jgi:hypothetical protein
MGTASKFTIMERVVSACALTRLKATGGCQVEGTEQSQPETS